MNQESIELAVREGDPASTHNFLQMGSKKQI
jgi:hypothetical protein